MRFRGSEPFTVGIELEVQIVDSSAFYLVPKSEEVFASISSPLLHKEFLRSMIEFVSSVHDHPASAVEEVKEIARRVVLLGREKGFFISASGTHPFADPDSVRVTDDKRYLKLLDEFQEVLRNFLIYGLHIHVGFPDEVSAVNAYNALVKFSPLFLALSASSPFFKGRYTGLYSYRSKIFEQLPRAGIPQQFGSFEEFSELFNLLKETGVVESLKDIWWDVRIRPDFGTVELRVCDSTSDFNRILALVSLAVVVGELFMEGGVVPEFHQLHLQNKWYAARYGLNAPFIDRNGRRKVGSVILSLVESYRKRFNRFSSELKVLESYLSKPTHAEVQFAAFSSSGDLREAVRSSLLEV